MIYLTNIAILIRKDEKNGEFPTSIARFLAITLGKD